MPRPEQSEDSAGIIAAEESINFIETQNQWRRELFQHLTFQVTLKINAGTEEINPHLMWRGLQLEFVSNQVSQRNQQLMIRSQTVQRQSLQINLNNGTYCFARTL